MGFLLAAVSFAAVARRQQSASVARTPQDAAPIRSGALHVATKAAGDYGTLDFTSVDLGMQYAEVHEAAFAADGAPRTTDGHSPATTHAGSTTSGVLHREIASRAVTRKPQLDELDVLRFGRIQMLGELAASLAHELGQPLSAIRSNAQAARRFLARPNPPLDEVRAILDDIDADDQRAGEVIHGMRALLQHHQVDMELVDVNVIVRGAARLVHGDCVLRRVAMVLDLDEPLPPVRCDRVQIQQVLLNLIVNAFAAMRDTGQRERRLIVRTRAENASAELSVHDTGTGIAAQHLTRLFDQFFTTKPDGLGMGLSIARSIVIAHGGRIWATNNSDCGATFHVVLPCAPTTRDQ